MIKPDGVRRGLTAEILSRLQRKGYRVVGLKQMVIPRELAEQHYAEQIAEIGAHEPELAVELQRFRDDEIAHHDHAVAHGSRETPGHALLTAAIKAGCRAAIKVSEKV